MTRSLGALLLRPLLASAVVTVALAVPILALGEASDGEARVRARAEMFEAGAAVAERTASKLERNLASRRSDIAVIAAGDLRQALIAGDRAGLTTAARLIASRGLACHAGSRIAVTDAQGRQIAEVLTGPTDAGCLVARPPGKSSVGPASPGVQLGPRDDAAASLIAKGVSDVITGESMRSAYALPVGSVVSELFLHRVGNQDTLMIAISNLVFPSESSLSVIGLVLLEFPAETLLEELTPALTRSEDVYVFDRTGHLLMSARPQTTALLADLAAAPLVGKAIRSQPVLRALGGPVTLREDAPDPLAGASRPFATAVMNELGWHVFVVPDQSVLRTVEGSLAQLRWMRIGLALVLVLGAFMLAQSAQAISRQRLALANANTALGG